MKQKGEWGKQIEQQRVGKLQREEIGRREKKHRRHRRGRHEPCTHEKKLVERSAA